MPTQYSAYEYTHILSKNMTLYNCITTTTQLKDKKSPDTLT